MLLLNERDKLSHQIFTINAHSCLYSAKKLVEGEYEDRAHDFREALRESVLDDWVVYFRPNGLYPGLRQSVRTLVQDYRSLNTLRPRIDPSAATWAYEVTHESSKRRLTIPASVQLTEEEVVAKFLRKWRSWLDQALDRKSIELPVYYAGSQQVAAATKQWMSGEITSFSIVEIQELASKERHEVVKHTASENTKQSHQYRRSLAA